MLVRHGLVFLPLVGIGIISGVIAVVNWIAGAVVDIGAAIAAALAAVWSTFGPILAAIWRALSGVFDTVIKPIWDKLKAWGETIWQAYVDHIKPIVDWVENIAKALRKIYTTFIQPIRDLLSILEQFLQLTGLANTAFGQWLDGELHRLDGALADMWAKLTAPINLLLHLVNEVILDARGILQAPLLLESTATYMGTICAQFINKSASLLHTDWKGVLDSFHTGPRIQPSIDDGRELIRLQSGRLADAVDHGYAAFQLVRDEQYEQFDYLTNGVGPGNS